MSFYAASQNERVRATDLFTSRGINATFTPATGYDTYDATFTGKNGTTYIVEVKCRNNAVDKYPDHLLEEKKANALLALHQQTPNSKVWYINFFRNGYIIFDITERIKNQHLLKVDTRACNQYTAVQADKIDKKVFLLDVMQGDLKHYQ
jgi:hypothetical protein